MAAVVAGGTPLGSTSNTATYAYGAFTPTANDLLVVVASFTGQTSATLPSCSDNQSGAYTRIAGASAVKSNGDAYCVFVRNTLASAVSTTITVVTNNGNATGCELTVLRVSGMTKVGSAAVRSSGVQSISGTSSPPAVTLNQAPLTGNPTIVGYSCQSNPPTMTAPTNYTERSDIGHTTPAGGQHINSRDSGQTAATITWPANPPSTGGTFGIELDASSGSSQTATPGVVALTITPLTPTVSAPRLVTVGTASLSLTPLVPQATAPIVVTVGKVSAVTATFAPAISTSSNQAPIIGVLSLSLAGPAPTVTASDHKLVTIGLATAGLTGLAPSVTASDHKSVTIGSSAVTTALLAPTVTGSDHKTSVPGAAGLTITVLEPTVAVSDHKTAVPDMAALSTARFVPSIAVSDNQLVTVDATALDLTALGPDVAVSDHQLATPGLASLTVEVLAPEVIAGNASTVVPGVLELSLTAKPPTVTVAAVDAGPWYREAVWHFGHRPLNH